jgi:hypothetical protein
VHLVRVAGVEGNEGGKVLTFVKYAAAVGVLLGEDVAVEAASVLLVVVAGRF